MNTNNIKSNRRIRIRKIHVGSGYHTLRFNPLIIKPQKNNLNSNNIKKQKVHSCLINKT